MGKNARKGGESADETLRGKLREMQKELRRKDQEIKQLEKQIEKLTGRAKIPVAKSLPVDENACPECGKGTLNKVEFPRRDKAPLQIISCTICDYKVRK